ncbi:MAG: hypothetical protein WDA75_00425 [Candidatus Latescibacterota bacterium]|jgi:hypothetical protein
MAVGISAGIRSEAAAAGVIKAAAAAARRVEARTEAARAEGEVRDRIMKRVDELVKGMETLAQHMKAEDVSTTRRSVLYSRYNELQRQVNRIDGIVGSEGQESRAQQAVASAGPGTEGYATDVPDPEENPPAQGADSAESAAEVVQAAPRENTPTQNPVAEDPPRTGGTVDLQV